MTEKICIKCRESKPLSEFYPRKSRGSGYDSKCKSCMTAAMRAFRKTAHGKMKDAEQRRRRRKKMTPEEKLAKHQQAYRKQKAKPEQVKKRYKSTKEWRQRNPHKSREYRAQRRAKLLQATPAFANRDKIKAIYALATLESKLTGRRITVDHIVPLSHPLVCGLHVEYNLSPVTDKYNFAKRNHTWPDMP